MKYYLRYACAYCLARFFYDTALRRPRKPAAAQPEGKPAAPQHSCLRGFFLLLLAVVLGPPALFIMAAIVAGALQH